jgi:hypothetical protein
MYMGHMYVTQLRQASHIACKHHDNSKYITRAPPDADLNLDDES